MKVYGPPGTTEMMGHFKAAYRWDVDYRTLVGVHKEGSELLATDLTPGEFYLSDDLKITTFSVEHMPTNTETGESLGLDGATY